MGRAGLGEVTQDGQAVLQELGTVVGEEDIQGLHIALLASEKSDQTEIND